MLARQALDRLWRIGCAWFAFCSVNWIVFAIALNTVGDQAPFYDNGYFVADIIQQFSLLFFPSIFTRNRHKIMALLTSLNAHEQARSAGKNIRKRKVKFSKRCSKFEFIIIDFLLFDMFSAGKIKFLFCF